MLFGGMEDSHDRRTQQIMANRDVTPGELTNFKLVGIRRRLNNIEVGIWLTLIVLSAHVWRHW
jgi:hypothetical protein